MRSIDNAVTDVMDELRLARQLDHSIVYEGGEEERWIVRFISKPGAAVLFVLEIEIFGDFNDPTLCVLHSVGATRRTLERIMDLLEERLTMPRLVLPSTPSPPGGS